MLADHRRRDRLRAGENAPKVHRDHGIEVRFAHDPGDLVALGLHKLRVAQDPSVVHENVDPAVLLRNRGRAFRCSHHIGHVHARVSAIRDIPRHDIGAGVAEHSRGLGADPACAAGDDRDLAVEPEHHMPESSGSSSQPSSDSSSSA